MTGIIQENGWALKYTIGSVICGPVSVGDIVYMPDGRDLEVIGGRAPSRVKDTGGVRIADSATVGGLEARPGALGLVWQHEGGGIAETI